jgi:carboxyl-terminal processing protease
MRKLNSSAVGLTSMAFLAVGLLVNGTIASAGQPPPTGQSPNPVLNRDQRAPEFPKPRPPVGSKALAELVWSISEAVAKHHDKPCPREQIIRASLKELYSAAKSTPPSDLGKRSAEINASAQLALLYDAVLSKSEGPAQAKLEEAALQGALRSIPGHPALVEAPSKKEQAVQEQVSANRYVGIGIALFSEKDKHSVSSTVLRGAARKAGMKAGDVIESVDGKDTRGAKLAQVVDWLRGDEGSSVTVTVRQPGAAESRTLKMTRAKVPFEHVYGYRRIAEEEFEFKVDPAAPIAYLRLGSFSSSSLHELRQFERKLHAAGFRALVLDLRGCAGGSLQHAALLGGGLLDGNLMWTVRQDRISSVQEFRADHESLFRDWPVAVLINGQVGSAASLVAAALHDNGRAILVGEPDHMDGYIKSMFELPGQKESLVLATGRVERPKPDLGWPLRPDFLVKMTFEESRALMEWANKQEVTDRKFDVKDQAPADPQLAQATELLRAELSKANLTKNP